MGRPPSNGGPAFRFNNAEVAEMEAILQAHNAAMPAREMIETLAQKFSTSPERSGKFVVQMKQVWNWFQNRRYAIRARTAKFPGNQNVAPLPRDDSEMAKNVAQAPQPHVAPLVTRRNLPQAPQHLPAPAAVNGAGKNVADSTMEFEAKSARDGAWYDVASFISHRNLETGDPEVLVRFAGFGAEEDEWINICRHVRQRSLPCESSECVAVLPGDLILCFQEGKEQALYFDAHVLDSQRRRHDIRGCRCRFLVRYDHDQSEEIVPLRKVCRRPETDHRLQSLHALSDSATPKQPKAVIEHRISTLRVYPPPEVTETQLKKEEHANVIPMVPATSDSNLSADGTKNQPAKDYEIADAGTVENSDAPPGSGFQLPENPEVMDAVIQKDSSAAPGNDAVIHENAVDAAATNIQGELNMTTEHNAVDAAATNIQGELNMTTEHNAVDEAATNIQGEPNMTAEHDAVNEVPVNATDTNIQGELDMTTEHDAVDEAATNIQGEMNMAVGNDAVKEVPTDIQGGQNETAEKDVVSNDNATNIEGDSNGMLEYEAVTSTSTIAEQ